MEPSGAQQHKEWDLPPELLEHIGSFLVSWEFLAARVASKAFVDALSSSIPVVKLPIHAPSASPGSTVSRLPQRFPGAQQLNLWVNTSSARPAQELGSALRDALDALAGVQLELLNKIQLQVQPSITLISKPPESEWPAVLSQRQQSAQSAVSSALEASLSKLSALKSLTSLDVSTEDSLQAVAQAVAAVTQLLELKLQRTGSSSSDLADIPPITSLTNLRTLVLSCHLGGWPSCFPLLTALTALTSLELAHKGDSVHVEHGAPITALKGLRVLRLKYCTVDHVAPLTELASLTALDLTLGTLYPAEDDSELWEVLRSMTALQHLNVNAWQESPLDDDKLAELALVRLPVKPSHFHDVDASTVVRHAQLAGTGVQQLIAVAAAAHSGLYGLMLMVIGAKALAMSGRGPRVETMLKATYSVLAAVLGAAVQREPILPPGLTSLGLLLGPSSQWELAALQGVPKLQDLTLVMTPENAHMGEDEAGVLGGFDMVAVMDILRFGLQGGPHAAHAEAATDAVLADVHALVQLQAEHNQDAPHLDTPPHSPLSMDMNGSAAADHQADDHDDYDDDMFDHGHNSQDSYDNDSRSDDGYPDDDSGYGMIGSHNDESIIHANHSHDSNDGHESDSADHKHLHQHPHHAQHHRDAVQHFDLTVDFPHNTQGMQLPDGGLLDADAQIAAHALCLMQAGTRPDHDYTAASDQYTLEQCVHYPQFNTQGNTLGKSSQGLIARNLTTSNAKPQNAICTTRPCLGSAVLTRSNQFHGSLTAPPADIAHSLLSDGDREHQTHAAPRTQRLDAVSQHPTQHADAAAGSVSPGLTTCHQQESRGQGDDSQVLDAEAANISSSQCTNAAAGDISQHLQANCPQQTFDADCHGEGLHNGQQHQSHAATSHDHSHNHTHEHHSHTEGGSHRAVLHNQNVSHVQNTDAQIQPGTGLPSDANEQPGVRQGDSHEQPGAEQRGQGSPSEVALGVDVLTAGNPSHTQGDVSLHSSHTGQLGTQAHGTGGDSEPRIVLDMPAAASPLGIQSADALPASSNQAHNHQGGRDSPQPENCNTTAESEVLQPANHAEGDHTAVATDGLQPGNQAANNAAGGDAQTGTSRADDSGDKIGPLSPVLRSLKQLRKIRLHDNTGHLAVAQADLRHLGQHWKQLQVAYVLGTVMPGSIEAAGFGSLTHLDLYNKEGNPLYDLPLDCLPRQLRALGVQNVRLCNGHQAQVVQQRLEGLSLYSASEWRDEDNGGVGLWQWIAGCGKLYSLTLEFCAAHWAQLCEASPAASPIRPLHALTTLRNLGVFFAESSEQQAALLDPRLVRDLAGLTGLEELEIWNCSGSDWAADVDLCALTALTHLRQLKLDTLRPEHACKVQEAMEAAVPGCRLKLTADPEHTTHSEHAAGADQSGPAGLEDELPDGEEGQAAGQNMPDDVSEGHAGAEGEHPEGDAGPV